MSDLSFQEYFRIKRDGSKFLPGSKVVYKILFHIKVEKKCCIVRHVTRFRYENFGSICISKNSDLGGTFETHKWYFF